jgi:hypothetical protein
MTNELCRDQNTPGKCSHGKKMEKAAWGICLIMTGALWLVPQAWAPEGTWLTGVGIILLGLNAARHLRGLKTDAFGMVVGFSALVAGVGRVLGSTLPFVPLLLVVLGAAMIIKVASRKEKPAGANSASIPGVGR